MTLTSATLETLRSINPADGSVVGEVRVTPVGAIPAQVQHAREAQKAWKRLSPQERGEILRPVGGYLLERVDELGRLISLEMGKPLREAVGEVRGIAVGWSDELTDLAEAFAPDELEDARTRSWVYHDPFGVCAAISPWNFPIGMPHSLVLPALMAGNAVLLKPSEESPLIAQAYVDALNTVLPPQVLQCIHGADGQGKALVASTVDLIAFTGSRETGKHILAAAAPGLKRVILELGGKDPLIVLDDADLEAAASFAAMNSFRNAGQVCVSTERIFVQDAVADQFLDLLAERTRALKVGKGTDDGVQVGPMVNSRQRDHVLRQLDAAITAGARVVVGGEGHHGNFITPTVLTDVRGDMDIMCGETFGPVACVKRFTTDDDAVEAANDTPFGLGAVVFGEPARALGVARRLDAGMIGVNKSCGGASGSPWVGAKESGYGYHSSREGHRQFAQARVVSVPKA